VSPSPRILFVTHNFPRFAGDAAGSFVLRLARALTDAGAHVHVLAPAAAGLAERDVIEGVSVQRVRYASDDRQVLAYEGTMAELVRESWSARFALAGLLWTMRSAARRAVEEARRAGTPYDIVHAHWWFPSGLSLRASNIGSGGTPALAITMHGSDVRLARTVRPAHAIMRSVLARAKVVTAVSTWLAEQAMAIAPAVHVHVAPMPIDVSRFTPPPADTARDGGVLFVGRLNAQKGLRDLLHALGRTTHAVPCDIIGDGPDLHALQQYARSLGVESRLTWHRALPSSELPAFYRRALVTVMPSREEGLGLVAVESQCCATPVIAYASGGLPDVVNPDAGGTLVPLGDTAALARAIDELAEYPTRAHERGSRAREHMLHAFSPSQVAHRYLELYDLG
jgi:glycosyltransferase involved in cell wall biosynthesis